MPLLVCSHYLLGHVKKFFKATLIRQITNSIIVVFASFRIWATWNQKWTPFLVILVISLTTPCLNLVSS